MILEQQFVIIYASFLAIVKWHFHIWALFFSGKFIQKVIVSCFFQIHLFRKRLNKPDGSCNVTSDSQLLYKSIKEQSFYFCKHIWKIHCKEYCIARYDDKMCFLPNCSYPKILTGDIKELLKIGCILFQLPTRGLSVYTFQVPIQWQISCQEWTTLW